MKTAVRKGNWPSCTIRGCSHVGPVKPDERLSDTHLSWVSVSGHAVCACHLPGTAAKVGVVQFTGKACR